MMRSWILLFALISALVFVDAIDEGEAKASIATQNDSELNGEENVMEDIADEKDTNDELSFDAKMEAPSGFKLTIPRRHIIAAKKLSVSIPLLLPGNGINTLARLSYCFHRLRYFPSRNGFRGWRFQNLVGYVVSGNYLYVFWRCDQSRI